MARLNDITNAAIRAVNANFTATPATLAIQAAAAATVKTTGTLAYTNGGVFKTKAALASQSIVPTHNQMGMAIAGAAVQPINSLSYLLFCLDAAGVVKVVQGGVDGQRFGTDPALGLGAGSNMGTSFVGNSDIPDTPDGLTAFGALKVVTGGGATFTPGTTALDAAGIAFTFMDLAMNPGGRP